MEKEEWRESSEFYFSLPILCKETGRSHPGWNQDDRLLNIEENPGASIFKGWDDKQDCGYIPDTFM